MQPYSDITDEQWQRVAPLLPELWPRAELRGRPLANTRAVLNGVLWVMYSGATWSSMPRRYPSYQTCHRRFRLWYETGALKRVIEQLLGPASEEVCQMMEVRIRRHVGAHPKRAEAPRAPTVARVPSPAYTPATPPPLPASPFAYGASFNELA
ncbi:transposase [Paraburkholderia antibiotica]|uniref:Transposase n=1 Tax=Paraburkholderia antibiotica TaxID=2728839 RepID=A0A7X9ZXP2_9BURK|nr:transposase [Paraburkholderia antibiotica]NML32257.1 transposase [Paraburkholderia antibiotica]